MEFERGVFQPFRATDNIHLGAIETNVVKGEVVLFDGSVTKIAGQDHSVPSMIAAIKEGWFVPESSAVTTREVKAAGVRVRPADSADRKSDQVMAMSTVEDDERAVGSVTEAQLGYREGKATDVEGAEDGAAVAKIKTAAKQSAKLTDSQAASKAIRELDNKPPPKAEAVATGDVEETLVGEDLEELLPKAASTQKPAPGTAGEGDRPHMTATEKAEYARKARLAQFGVSPEEEPVATVASTTEEPQELEKSELDQKLAIIRLSIPDFEWDLNRQWRARVKAATDNYRDNPLYLNSILAIETDAVKKHILKALAK
jgi:hypothetical protein